MILEMVLWFVDMAVVEGLDRKRGCMCVCVSQSTACEPGDVGEANNGEARQHNTTQQNLHVQYF